MPSCVYAFVMKNVQIIMKLNKLSQNSKQVFWLSWLLTTGSFLLNKSATFLITGRIDSVTCIWLPAVNGKQELCGTMTEVYFVLLSCWHQYIFACIIFVTAFCECRSSKRMITLNFFFWVELVYKVLSGFYYKNEYKPNEYRIYFLNENYCLFKISLQKYELAVNSIVCHDKMQSIL